MITILGGIRRQVLLFSSLVSLNDEYLKRGDSQVDCSNTIKFEG